MVAPGGAPLWLGAALTLWAEPGVEDATLSPEARQRRVSSAVLLIKRSVYKCQKKRGWRWWLRPQTPRGRKEQRHQSAPVGVTSSAAARRSPAPRRLAPASAPDVTPTLPRPYSAGTA